MRRLLVAQSVAIAIIGANLSEAANEGLRRLVCDDAAVARLSYLMNPVRLGASSGARHSDRHVAVSVEAPVGQTFRTSASADCIVRIAFWQAFWHETWGPDEILVVTLWDSPAKRVSLGRAHIPYSRRMWEGAVPMPVLEARVEPDSEYYFEITCDLEPLRPAETPREWVLGRAPGPGGKRPGFAGADGRIEGIGVARDDYPGGTAFVAGQPQSFDLWFEVHETHRADADTVLAQAFSTLDLDYPPLATVKDAVERRDWPRAVEAVVQYFEAREDLFPERREMRHDPTVDLTQADLACQHRVLLEDGTTVDLGPEWNHYTLWPERGGVGLTRSGLRKWLAQGYAATGHPKYARAFSDMLWHVFRYCPSPLLAGAYRPDEVIPAALPAGIAGGSMWSALSIGARIGHGFYYYATFVDSPDFPIEIRAAFILNLGQMADVLERMQGGGNWETQMAEALFDVGLTYPEFRNAKERVRQGLEIAVRNAMETIRPDGVLREPTTNYHMLVMNRFSSIIERTRQLGLELPEEMTQLVERMFDYIMYATMPDGTLPAWGDSGNPSTPDLLERGARLFNREDFRYAWAMRRRVQAAAAAGPEVPSPAGAPIGGTPPEKTSVAFPSGGYYYMRTGWEQDAHYLALHCGPYGSHGHDDTLGIVAAAYGRTVLFDPGICTYGTPEAAELKATISHNTVTVDRRDALPGTADAWATAKGFDYFAGHNHGYRGFEGVTHHRRIWFLKPAAGLDAVWLILDDVTGAGDHTCQLWYRFAPAPVNLDAASLRVWTAEDGGNLVLNVLGQPQPVATLGRGIGVWDGLREVPVACFESRGVPAWFATVAVPFRGRQPPSWSVRALDDAAAAGWHGIWAENGAQACLWLCPPVGSGGERAQIEVTLPDVGQVSFSGEGLAMRMRLQDKQWVPVLLHAVKPGRLQVGAKIIPAYLSQGDVVDLTL
ncbi:MAG: heparinase II/III family protein [Armatimonadetes bacterium]|nr:heparinase II/III family protein [Armatimonadota bacterium]